MFPESPNISLYDDIFVYDPFVFRPTTGFTHDMTSASWAD